jgi:hypothetical protein
MKTRSNSGDFTKSRIRISNSGGTSKTNGNLNQPMKKTTANYLSVVFKSNTENSLKISGLRNNLRITGGFLNEATSILKRVSVRLFKISKCFHIEASKNLNSLFSITRHQKYLKTIGAYT